MNDIIYKKCKSVENLEVSYDGQFLYKGKPKKVCFSRTILNRKATAKLQIMINTKSHYYQAAKLVAEAWIARYDIEKDYLIYKDQDIHNISASNLIVTDKKGYWKYMRRNSGYVADDIEERKRKLQLVADEALMTKRYFETLKMDEINKHVTSYLYPTLMHYALHTVHLGEKKAMREVPNAIARMYECIMNGMCLYNYERYLKQLLLNYKKKGSFGFTGKVPKPIEINVEQLNLDCLWERYKVKKIKS